jgi:hypothetical protein
VLQNGGDALVNRLLNNTALMSWQSLIVLLTHQSTTRVRDAGIIAICRLLLRSDVEKRLAFVKSCGFALLANQLREYPCTSSNADAVFGLLCGETVQIRNGYVMIVG